MHAAKILKESDWLKILNNLWFFIVRARYSDISPSGYERIFARMCNYITTSNDKPTLIKKLDADLTELFGKVSSNDTFISHFIQDISFKSDPHLVRQTIRDIMHLQNPGIVIDEPDIEHILPQNPFNWGIDQKDVADYVHTIGNLTLLTKADNQDLCKDKSFKDKSKVYQKSDFNLNKEIVTKWGDLFINNYKEAIEKRGAELATLVSTLWTYYPIT